MGKVTSDLTNDEKDVLEQLLFYLGDNEFVHANRISQVIPPTLESGLALSNIEQEELGHARLWYGILEEFGYDEADLLFEREKDAFAHSAFLERPLGKTDWATAVVRMFLYDHAEELVYRSLQDSSFRPISDRASKALQEESYHRTFAMNWIEKLTETGEGRDRVQKTVEDQYPWALTLFTSEIEPEVVNYGFCAAPLGEYREQWVETTRDALNRFDISVAEELLSEGVVTEGRTGQHTPAWDELYANMTTTYHDLDQPTPPKLIDVNE